MVGSTPFPSQFRLYGSVELDKVWYKSKELAELGKGAFQREVCFWTPTQGPNALDLYLGFDNSSYDGSRPNFCCSCWVWLCHFWFWFGKFPLKFSVFSHLSQKISSGQVKKYPGQRWVSHRHRIHRPSTGQKKLYFCTVVKSMGAPTAESVWPSWVSCWSTDWFH